MTNEDRAQRTLNIQVRNPRYVNRRRELQTTSNTSNTNLTLDQLTNVPTVESIVGGLTNVSPIIKQPLTFQLSSLYVNTLTKADLTLVQIRNDAKNYVRDLYVMSVDPANRQFTVKFNGAPPGTYYFAVTSAAYGRLSTSAISFQTSSFVNSVSPSSGSVFGGTLLTLTGTNFSTNKQDLAVKVGDYYCDIVTTTMTQLTCRIRATGLAVTNVQTADVILFLAASFESVCINATACKFSFQAPTTTVTSLTPGFDAVTNTAIVTLVGSGFTAGDTSSVSLYIDGVKQTTTSVASDTEAKFTITDLQASSTTRAEVFFTEGNSNGFNTTQSLTFVPNLISVSPNSAGSQGGTLVTVIGTGFGKNTTGLGLKDKTTSTALCSKVNFVSYGKFTCLTNTSAVASSDQIVMTQGTTEYTCANSNTSLCAYQQQASSSPTITSVTISGNVASITGSNFPSSASYTAIAKIKSSEVTITGWDATTATATFAQGIPATATTELNVAKIIFTRTSDSVQFITYSNNLSFQVLADTAVTAASSSSYAGGIKYTMTANNLFATLKEAGNGVSICGNPCVLSDADSDYSKAVCITPSLSTIYSSTNYLIGQPGVIKSGKWTSSAGATEVAKVTDDKWPTEFTSTSANPWIEVAFPDTQVGVIDSVKILINNLNTTKAPFTGVTKLQGFNGSAYVDILTLDSTIHEGWNTFTFDAPNKPAYQKYKWTGATAGSCRFGEIKFIGTVSVNEAAASRQCTPKLTIGSATTDLSIVTYSNTDTPTISSITPRYGKVQGGETITIVGSNFVTGSTSVTIDGIPCTSPTVTATQITCTTGSRPGDEKNPSFVVMVDGKGRAANQGNTFRYVSYWSEHATWGNDAPPQFGEAIQIPAGRSLLVDVDSVPQLSFIVVEGALIFAPNTNPNHQRTFDAGYIFINGGYMEVGTEAFPYTSKMTITMHGDVTTPAIPTYGNKNIAVRKGELHLVGKPREVTWTMLDSTSNAGSNTITLLAQPATFDWAVGEEIVIASTDYDHTHSETAFITAVADHPADGALTLKRKVLTLSHTLVYKHFAQKVMFGSTDFIEMRAEVGLLTRNVKYQGDPETSPKNLYGAHIMIHYPEDESCIGRILYTEFFNVGQAFKLGRYPIHFHVIGTVAKSLVKGNAIHQTYNRAVTIHAVSYFNVENNVVYNAMGHNIFIEDAIETKNVIKHNLVVSTRRSWSLLNTDQTPASFWITHPDNIFIGNHAAGSDRYGYWYDTQETPINGSYTDTICPINEKIGEFRDNETHSNGRYGLRLFHKLVPRTRGCDPWIFDNSNPSAAGAPYPSNPAIPARFYNLVSWKNGRNGAIGEELGAVEFHNFKVADNLLAGIEMSFADKQVLDKDIMLVKDALVVGSTPNSEDILLSGGGTRGIIGPRWDFFTIRNIKFYNLNFGSSGALGDCSHCFHPASTDSGARQYFSSGLFFDTTVPKRVWYQYPFRGIWQDLDGSLTGYEANSWAVAYHKYNDFAGECTYNSNVYDGHICHSSVQVRRIAFNGMSPGQFQGMEMKIRQYDDSMTSSLDATALAAFQNDATAYSVEFFKSKKDPTNSWALPFVTGHKYRMYWDKGQLNWTNMRVEVSRMWQPTDKQILFNHPYTENYEFIDFFNTYGAKYSSDTDLKFYSSTTLNPSTQSTWLSGYNSLDKVKKEVNFVINGKTESSKTIQANSVKCRLNEASWCTVAAAAVECTGTPKNWSDPATWITTKNPAGGVPTAGQDVEIPAGVIINFDIAVSPKLNMLKVVGCLNFRTDNTIDQTLHAYQIYVLGGKLNIGSSTAPYTRKARIVLYGDYNSQFITMPGAAEAGNKMIANAGMVKMFGKDRSRMSRLTAECQKGSTSCTVDIGLDWVAGDELGFAPTASQHNHYEVAVIASYNSSTGALTLTSPLKFYHFGAAASTAANYQGIDMRGEVILLTRNIVIEGDQTENNWYGQFLTLDTILLDASGGQVDYKGITNLKNVELRKMGQKNNFKAALRFDNSNSSNAEGTPVSTIENVSMHQGDGWGVSVKSSSNISFKNCDVFDFEQIGVNFDITTNVIADSLNVFGVRRRTLNLQDNLVDKECCFAVGSFTENTKLVKTTVKNSIAAGCVFAGFIAPGYSCSDTVGASTTNVMTGNIAHSSEVSGFMIFPDISVASTSTCYQADNLKTYKNSGPGVGVLFKSDEFRVTNYVGIDNTRGISLNLALETDTEKLLVLKDSFIYGETSDLAKDCPDGSGSATGAQCYCKEKMGHMSTISLRTGKEPYHIPMASSRPVYKAKSYSTWNNKATLDNVQFLNFKSQNTLCGSKQSVFAVNPYASDGAAMHHITNSKFTNVKQDALIFIYDPPQGWANIDDCGEWPCTMPSNMVYTVKDAVFEVTDGVTPLPTFWTAGVTTKYTFQMVSDFATAAGSYPNCSKNELWNAWLCADPAQTAVPQIGTLNFESLDGDTEDRSVQPVRITNSDGYLNILNSYMDHEWDGFYTGQHRLSRFHAQILTGKSYTIQYTGTPFKNARYHLKADAATKGILLKIPYPNAGSYSVKVNGNLIQPQPWDLTTKAPKEIDVTTATCGANLYRGVVNYLQFFITAGCTVVVVPRDAIHTSTRLQWTADEFFASGGVTTFTQRLGAVLGIDITRIKVVAVYEGSLIVETQILDNPATQTTNANGTIQPSVNSYTELKALEQKLSTSISGSSALGAPVLQFAVTAFQTSATPPTVIVAPTIIPPSVPSIAGGVSMFAMNLVAALFVLVAVVF